MSTALIDQPEPKSRAHLWQPGQTGNPNGRPRVIGAVRDLARAHTIECVANLAEIMRDKTASHHARVAAISELLDRAWGKAPQKVDVDVTIFDAMDPATRAALDGIVAILEQVQVRPVVTIDAQAVAIEPEKSTDSVDPMSPTP